MRKLVYITILIQFFWSSPAFCQRDSIELSEIVDVVSGGLFDSDEIVDVTLRFDITHFRRTKFKSEYQDAVMTYYIGDRDTVTRNIRIRSRGEFRREYCDFPPIRLNLRKKEPPDDEFGGMDKIKMVTHCKAGGSDYVLREYLVYKLYSVLTDVSFKVRLLRMHYINTRNPNRPIIEYAFLIEPDELLAERTKSLEVASPRLSQKFMKPDVMDRVAIFNYMIGNYDWSVPRMHNLVVLSQPKSKEPHLGLLVPYDFDYSGIVNTDYSIPPETLPIKSVRERLYLGICREEEVFRQALNEFNEKQDELIKVIAEFPYLRERSKRDMISYLRSFFNDFDKRGTIVYKLLNQCQDF